MTTDAKAAVVCIYCLDVCDLIDAERAPFARIKAHPALTFLEDDGASFALGAAAFNRVLTASARLPDERPPCRGSLMPVRQL